MIAGKEDRRANLFRAAHQNASSSPSSVTLLPMRCSRHALRQVAVAVFHHDDGGIDQDADGQRQSAQRHDVGTDMQEIHRDEGRDETQSAKPESGSSAERK